MRLKVPALLLLSLLVIAVFFLGTWQGLRYQWLLREVRELELQQQDRLEQNKKIIAALAVLSSPQRVQALAEQKLGLKLISPSDLSTVVLPPGGGQPHE
jgi:cell division protein FtsL